MLFHPGTVSCWTLWGRFSILSSHSGSSSLAPLARISLAPLFRGHSATLGIAFGRLQRLHLRHFGRFARRGRLDEELDWNCGWPSCNGIVDPEVRKTGWIFFLVPPRLVTYAGFVASHVMKVMNNDTSSSNLPTFNINMSDLKTLDC